MSTGNNAFVSLFSNRQAKPVYSYNYLYLFNLVIWRRNFGCGTWQPWLLPHTLFDRGDGEVVIVAEAYGGGPGNARCNPVSWLCGKTGWTGPGMPASGRGNAGGGRSDRNPGCHATRVALWV